MRGKGERNDRMGWRGVSRGWLDIYYLPLLKGGLPQENSIYVCIFLNTSSSFQLSLSLKHTSQITFVCGCSVMISVASQRCFLYVVVFFCLFVCFWAADRLWGAGRGEHSLVSPGAVQGLSQGKDEADIAPTTHTPTITPRNSATQMQGASASSAFLSFLCASLFLTFFPNCIQTLSGPALLLQYLNTSPGP